MVAYESLQLGYQLVAAAELQVGVDPVLERQESALFQLLCLARPERLVEDVHQRWAPPQRERGPKRIGGLSCSSANQRLVAAAVEALEAVEVELAGLDPKQVARRSASPAGLRRASCASARPGCRAYGRRWGAGVLPTIRRSADRARPSRSLGGGGERAAHAASAHPAEAHGRPAAPRRVREPGTPSLNVSTVTSALRGSCEVGLGSVDVPHAPRPVS